MPSVYEIVQEYLKKNGYDGLATDDCGCELSDLFPCGAEGVEKCEVGHKEDCDPEAHETDRPWSCEGNCAWHMVSGKRGEP